MAGENEAVTLLSYKVNTSSVQAAVQANKQVEASLRGVGAAATSSALRFDSIEQAQAALGLSASQLGATEANVTAELQRQLPLAERLAEAAKARASAETGSVAGLRADAFGGGGGQAGNPGLQRNLFNARQAAIALPGVGYQSPLTVGIRGAELLVAKTGASLVELGAAAGIAGVAVVAVALAFQEFTKGIEASKKVLTGALTAQDNYYKALGELTSEQVASRLDELKDQRDLIRQQRDETQAARDRAFSLTQGLTGDAAARALEAAGLAPGAQLQTQLDELNKQYEASAQTLVRLQQGLESGAFAANDARAAYEALSEAQVESANLILRANSLTAEEREKRIRELQAEQQVLQELIDAEGTTYAARQELMAQWNGLSQQVVALTRVTNSYADVLAREEAAKQALTDRNDNYLDLLDQEADAREKALGIQTKIIDLQVDASDKLQDLAIDRADRLQEIEATSGERLAEIAENAADQRYKIERDAGRAIEEAIGNRDENAFRQAKIKRADALEDQAKAGDKQVQTVAKQLAKQEATLDKSYAKQVANVNDGLNKQVAIQQRALAEQNFIIERSQASQAFLTANGMTNVVNTVAAGWNAVVNYTQTAFNNIFAAAAAQLSNTQIPVNYQTAPPLTGSAADRALNQRIDTRLNYTLQLAGRSSPR